MKTEALSFATPAPSDAPEVRALTTGARGNDLSFANLYLLREKYGITIAMEDGFLYRHYGGIGRLQGYAFPCGCGDAEAALRRLEADAAARHRPMSFCLLTDEEKGLLEQLRPGRYVYATDIGNADYLYRRSDLAELPGTAYHRKRNHIARFERNYPNWRFVELSPENSEVALEVARAWLDGREDAALIHEYRAIRHALELLGELDLCGGLICVGQQAVAMAVSSYISPGVADVHYEKCLPEFRDAYPVINRELARRLHGELINREEDLNNPGLRQAKESYHPIQRLVKYTAQALCTC